jgi:uncharacterized membrane protein YcaP (DUF421 family)
MSSSIDWRELFVPSVNPWELVLRASILYLLILTGFRLFRRDAGSLSVSDLLVVVLIADAAQNGMAGDYTSITEGAIIVATIFAWNFVLDWLAFHSKFAHWLLNPPPLLLVRNGRIQGRNLRAELITRDDLMEQLREQGIEDLKQVKQCCLESDGKLSVIRNSGSEGRQSDKSRGAGPGTGRG